MGDAELTSLPPRALAVAAAVLFAATILMAALVLVWGMAQRAKKPEHRVGALFGGERVEVVEWAGTEGYVRAGGELWRARSEGPIEPGEKVKVAGMDGLVLEVSKQ